MSGVSNFQDVVVLASNTLSFFGEQFVIGTAAGSKSIVFAQDPVLASAMRFVASNPTAQRTIILPDANGTVGLVTNFAAGSTSLSNGLLSFANSNGVTFGLNGSTITASVSPTGGGGVAVAAGTQTATSGTVVFSNSNNVTFGMSGSSVVTASAGPDLAYPLFLAGI